MAEGGEKKTIVTVGPTGAQGGALARAILNDPDGRFAVRALTRNTTSDKAKGLERLGAEVLAADDDDPESLKAASRGACGACCVTSQPLTGGCEEVYVGPRQFSLALRPVVSQLHRTPAFTTGAILETVNSSL